MTLSSFRRSVCATVSASLLGTFLGTFMLAGHAQAEDAASLRAQHAQMKERLEKNNFQRALAIDSTEAQGRLNGDVYAVLDHPYSAVSESLSQPSAWCDVLILPFNTKYCHAVNAGNSPKLLVRIGRKFDQPVQDAYKLEFAFQNISRSADFLETRLSAANGPLGTRDYRIVMTATPLEGNRTFMHMSYSYAAGMAGKIAMQGYLSTVGADKIGFTVTGRGAAGEPVYIGGMRGAIERNAMRYYLAIDSYLDSLSAPQASRVEKRIQNWFSATERYPRQLREMDRPTYVAMKRSEHERQQEMIN